MYLSDIHTHSIASGHGTICTISDMAKAASKKGLKLLGITDHGPGTLAAGTSSYFRSLTYAPKKRFGIELLFGVELNILDIDGHLDLNDESLGELDYAIASMHAQNYKSGSVKENTSAYLNAMTHPCVKVLGHCDNPAFRWIMRLWQSVLRRMVLFLRSMKLHSHRMGIVGIHGQITGRS